jgi:DnaK suppressor protein
MMNKTHKEFLERLNLKRKEFEQALDRLRENQKEYSEQFSGGLVKDESDHAQLEISVNSNYDLIERKTRDLKEIDRQIRRILRDEKISACEECGKPIPLERLLIVPEASLCIRCQREFEKDHSNIPTGRALSRIYSERGNEWRYSDDPNDFEGDLMDSELDFPSPLEGEESGVK